MSDAERAPLVPPSDPRYVTHSVINLWESLIEEPCTLFLILTVAVTVCGLRFLDMV